MCVCVREREVIELNNRNLHDFKVDASTTEAIMVRFRFSLGLV